MSATALSVILTIIETLLQASPAALALYGQLRDIIAGDRDPTSDEWAAIAAQMIAIHQLVQGPPVQGASGADAKRA